MAKSLAGWFALPHIAAGFIAVLVGYTSTVAIIFQAAHAASATPDQVASWLWALGVGMGVTCIGLSLWTRSPVLTAWSTPGAALLVTALAGVPMSDAIGAFLFSSALIAIAGFSGWFEKLMHLLPRALASAMLAGVLLRFGLETFAVLPGQPLLAGAMIAAFLIARRLLPRYAVPLTFLLGLAIAAGQHAIAVDQITIAAAHPVLTMPTLHWTTLLGVGLPLFVVTMASQNVPGLAVLRANGYTTPASPLIGWTGLTGLVLGPFGGFAFNLAAITAAICMSPDADADPARRYRAAMWAGAFYLAAGLMGGTVASLFAAFPHALVAAIAGLALLGTIGGSLAAAVIEEREREAAIVTFLVSASGLTLLGLGSAFWGLAFGLTTAAINRRR